MTPPFARIDMIPFLENELGFEFPKMDDLNFVEKLVLKCKDRKVTFLSPLTTSRVLDQLVKQFIEPKCINPTFIYGHPILMSPLAKSEKDRVSTTAYMN